MKETPSISFQFQLGAIGRVITTWGNRACAACFNSSLVRLGVPYHRTCHTVCFFFQFQLGAIGRYFFKGSIYLARFVSIPAWCDWESTKEVEETTIYGFNSSLVRLGEWYPSVVQVSAVGFNSSLVRLGGLWKVRYRNQKAFQFQLGAIGSS